LSLDVALLSARDEIRPCCDVDFAGAVCDRALAIILKTCNDRQSKQKSRPVGPPSALSGFAEICAISLASDAMPFKLKSQT
jgi:hypothetical protein